MIDKPTNRRTQNVKKTIANTNSVKTRKWEKLIGWTVEQDNESNYIGIETWSKRKLKDHTSADAFVEYLCSNDHFCSAIVDRDRFRDSSLDKEEYESNVGFEKLLNKDETKCDETYGKEEIAFDKSITENNGINTVPLNSIVQSRHVDPTEERNYIVKSSSSKGICCKTLKYESCTNSKVRPTSSNSLPENKVTRIAPRRHALSANDAYNFPVDISTLSNKVKFSYTKKDELSSVAKEQVENSTNENDVEETSSYQNELVCSYNFNHLQLPKKYELPNSTNVSIGDLLYSSPRIEMYHSRERDIVFAALANEINCDSSKMTTVLCDNYTDTPVGLPPVIKISKNINDNKKVNGFKTVAGIPKIPLLANNTSKSTNETLLNKVMMESNMVADATEEIISGKPASLGGYVTSSRCNDIHVNYTPKPRGPPAFRPTTSKTPLHRAIESAHKKIHGPHQRPLSKSISRLADTVVDAPTNNRRWSSSLPTNKQLAPEVNNTVAWRQELESHIRYQRTTSQLKASPPLINQATNKTTVAINKLSRRKKTQLRIGDKLYNIGIAAQSAGRLQQTRISVER